MSTPVARPIVGRNTKDPMETDFFALSVSYLCSASTVTSKTWKSLLEEEGSENHSTDTLHPKRSKPEKSSRLYSNVSLDTGIECGWDNYENGLRIGGTRRISGLKSAT